MYRPNCHIGNIRVYIRPPVPVTNGESVYGFEMSQLKLHVGKFSSFFPHNCIDLSLDCRSFQDLRGEMKRHTAEYLFVHTTVRAVLSRCKTPAFFMQHLQERISFFHCCHIRVNVLEWKMARASFASSVFEAKVEQPLLFSFFLSKCCCQTCHIVEPL